MLKALKEDEENNKDGEENEKDGDSENEDLSSDTTLTCDVTVSLFILLCTFPFGDEVLSIPISGFFHYAVYLLELTLP